MPISPYAVTPEHFLTLCQNRGVTIEEVSNILTLCKTFPAGDSAAYADAETMVGIIYEAPTTQAGSVWGTDGGSIGGYVGLKGGYMRLHKSGVSKRWLAKLRKITKA